MTTVACQSPVTVEVADGIGVIRLNRPDRLNAFGASMAEALGSALDEMGARTDVSVVILAGEGRAFCAGADLRDGLLVPDSEDPARASHLVMRQSADIVWAIRSIPQPVIAVVDGWAVGAGFALAAAADVRFVGPDARFSAPFLKLGMTVGDLGLSWFLPRLIGAGRAAHVFFDAGVIDAGQAAAWGLAQHVSEDAMAEALAYAERLAAHPAHGVQVSKQLLNASSIAGLREHLDAEARAQVIAALTRDAQQAMAGALAGKAG